MPGRHPRERARGIEVWRLRDERGHVQSCELRDDSPVGAGWEVLLLMDGEPQFSRRCADEVGARNLANAWKQDNLRGGWREAH
jgi:hypothetical protein